MVVFKFELCMYFYYLCHFLQTMSMNMSMSLYALILNSASIYVFFSVTQSM